MADKTDSSESTGPKLLQQAEKVLLQAINPDLMAYCPTMDLLAVATEEHNLEVYRINGQMAFRVARKNSKTKIDFACWKFNGQAIAIAWSDGLMDIISVETGKPLQKDMPLPAASSTSSTSGSGEKQHISFIGWGVNFIDVDAVRAKTSPPSSKKKKAGQQEFDLSSILAGDDDWDDLGSSKEPPSIEDFLTRNPNTQSIEISPNLPDQLAMLDLESLLPKLPALPLPPAAATPFQRMGAPQKDSGEFGSQAQVDAIFHSHHLRDQNAMDILVRCMGDGAVHTSIYESGETVEVRVPREEWGIESVRPVVHASDPFGCSHTILMELKMAGKERRTQLAMVPLTLGFITSAGVYLQLIASKTAQLQNLLVYLQQCLLRMRAFWKHARDLPSRFMMNVTDMLEEKGEGTLVENLYHLACTGSCPPVIKEWLVDQLAESGHKRWDHTVNNSLTKLLDLLHENFLPALDRCTLVLSRLRSLAQYSPSASIFNIPVPTFTSLLALLKNLRLLAHTIQLYASDEKRQFAVFSKWLRYEIDFEATEPGSQSREEMEGRDPGVDVGALLEYIRFSLTKSDIAPYLKPELELEEKLRGEAPCSYEETRKAVDLLKQEARYKEQAVCLDHVLRHFREGCSGVFQGISGWQAESTRMDCGVVVEEGEVGVVDVRMVHEPATAPDSSRNLTTYIALTPSSNPSNLHIHRLHHTPEIKSLPTSLTSYTTKTLSFSPSQIIDLKFADDKTIVLLLRTPAPNPKEADTFSILYIPFTPASNTDPDSPADPFPYSPTPLPPSTFSLPTGSPLPLSSRPTYTISRSEIQAFTKHTFEPRFQPIKMVVNGRKNRRVVVVLEKDKKQYRILDLDFDSRKKAVGVGKQKGKARAEGRESAEDADVDMLDYADE